MAIRVTSARQSGDQSLCRIATNGHGTPSYPAIIQASPNLRSAFTNFGTATADTNGNFQYQVPTTNSQMYFRAAYP